MAGVRVEGLNQTIASLRAAGVELNDLRGAFGPIAAKGAQIASRRAPHVSGKLSGSVRPAKQARKAVIYAGYGKSVPYAGPINYGWPKRNIKGSYFMQKASDEIEPFAVQELTIELNKIITRHGLG